MCVPLSLGQRLLPFRRLTWPSCHTSPTCSPWITPRRLTGSTLLPHKGKQSWWRRYQTSWLLSVQCWESFLLSDTESKFPPPPPPPPPFPPHLSPVNYVWLVWPPHDILLFPLPLCGHLMIFSSSLSPCVATS